MFNASLSRFLDNPSVRKEINECFCNPIKRTKTTLKFPPTKNMGVDFGTVGTAYDYWVRCYIIRSKKLDQNEINSFIGVKRCYKKYREAETGANKYIECLSNYVTGGNTSKKNVAESCLFFSKFEIEFRSGYPIENFRVNENNIDELINIINVSSYSWLDKTGITLNPVFGVHGNKGAISADGDLIVGKCLVDLKTSGTLKIKDDLRQLLGYVALNNFIECPYTIESVGVYYPRRDFYLELPLSNLMNDEQKKRLVDYFSCTLGA